jgi:hypothetical protein
MILFAVACKKGNDVPATVVNTTLPTTVYFYSSTDSTAGYFAYDTLTYNKLNKILKVTRHFTAAPADSIEYSFMYYNEHSVSDFMAISRTSKQPWFRIYRFEYTYDWKLDKMIYYNESNEATFNLTYDSNGYLHSYNSSFTRTNGDSIPEGMPYAKGVYYRTSKGGLDSIVTGVYAGEKKGDDTLFNTMAFKLNTNEALTADAIDQSYLLCLSSYEDFYLMSADFNYFLQQFFNGKSLSVFRSGTYEGMGFGNRPIDFTAVLNENKSVKWITNPGMINKTGWVMAKLVYGEVNYL